MTEKPAPKARRFRPTPELIRDAFATYAPIGTACLYYAVKPFKRAEAFETKIRSAPWILGRGAVVVMVEGRTGGVSIEHIALLTTQPETPAKSPAMLADYTANHLQGLVEPD